MAVVLVMTFRQTLNSLAVRVGHHMRGSHVSKANSSVFIDFIGFLTRPADKFNFLKSKEINFVSLTYD